MTSFPRTPSTIWCQSADSTRGFRLAPCQPVVDCATRAMPSRSSALQLSRPREDAGTPVLSAHRWYLNRVPRPRLTTRIARWGRAAALRASYRRRARLRAPATSMMSSSRAHRADHDPEEEHCAGGSRDVIAEHGRRVGRPAMLGTPTIVTNAARSTRINPTMRAFDTSDPVADLQYTLLTHACQQR